MIIDDIAIVENFLSDFFQKKKIFGIRYMNERMKNFNTLSDIETTPNERDRVVESLIPTDYSQGPIEDKMGMESDMWVFGKVFKKKEIYIKITMGRENKSVICISFHTSEKPMDYPFKSI